MSHTAQHGPVLINQFSAGKGNGIGLTIQITDKNMLTVYRDTIEEMDAFIGCLLSAAKEASMWNEGGGDDD